MHPADRAFIDQIKHDRDTDLYWLQQLAAGFRPHRDGIDITEEFAADARGRLADANGILDQYPDVQGRKRPADVTN
jgi:hypothetical protein